MAIFYTDSGSFNDLKVTGSSIISASRGIALQVRSSGSTIFSVSGSSGEIFNISDAGSSTALFTVASASTNILNVDSTKAVSVSGSLVVTGSAYIRGLGTTAQTSVVTIDTSTGHISIEEEPMDVESGPENQTQSFGDNKFDKNEKNFLFSKLKDLSKN